MTLDKILDKFPDKTFLKADGLDEAVIGVNQAGTRLIYSTAKILQILQTRDGMTEEEAQEFFDYNIECANVGPQTPIYRK